MSGRRFTVAQAEALLPELRNRIERIRRARHRLLRAAERIAPGVAANGGGRDGAASFEALEDMREDVEWIAEQGAILRDPEMGLVDFPAERDGREVYLCWRMGEERVDHWHPLDGGYASRRPLAG